MYGGEILFRQMHRIVVFAARYFCALASSIYLFALGFLFERNRLLISSIYMHFSHAKPTDTTTQSVKNILLKVDLSEVVPEDTAVQVREPFEIKGNISLLELIVVAKLVKYYKPQNLFEIGTFDGRTALNLAANCGAESKVYTLDLPQVEITSTILALSPGEEIFINKERSGSKYLGTDCEKKIIQLYGDSASFDFSPLKGTIDLVFIDGSHSYEYVLNDTDVALKLLRNGQGVILWHDYGRWEGVTKAVNEFSLRRPEFKETKQIEGTTLAYCTWTNCLYSQEVV